MGNENIFGKPKSGNEPTTLEQKLTQGMYEIRAVLNGPQNESMKKVIIKEKLESLLREVSP